MTRLLMQQHVLALYGHHQGNQYPIYICFVLFAYSLTDHAISLNSVNSISWELCTISTVNPQHLLEMRSSMLL